MAGLLALTPLASGLPESRLPLRLQRGVSLIEFLVVLVIITIGLLSVAGMLAFGIKQDYETVFRTAAATQAEDLAERMHGNLLGASLGFYKDGQTATVTCPTGTSTARCAAAINLALADRAAWNAATSVALPSATRAVTYDATTGIYTISVGWTENVRQPGGITSATARALTFRYQSIPEVYVR